MWGCFLMSGVKILPVLKDWWKSISVHQNYTMALKTKVKQYFFSWLEMITFIIKLATLNFIVVWRAYVNYPVTCSHFARVCSFRQGIICIFRNRINGNTQQISNWSLSLIDNAHEHIKITGFHANWQLISLDGRNN